VAPTEEPTLEAEYFPAGIPTPVPILYKMFDWGTDYQHLKPEWGPVGSIQFFMWEDVNPAPDVYDWSVIDEKLALEAPLKVTLPDGREIPKPVVIQVFPFISSAPGWDAVYYDGTPQWVYDLIDSQNPGDPRPIVNGRKVGHKLVGCGKVAVVPMFDSPTWRQAYYKMVRAFGARYGDNPQVTAIVINTGLDGETQPVKDMGCSWNTYLDQQASAVRYNFGRFVREAMAVYREAFPRKPIFINNAPGGSGMRKMTSDYAATFNPPIGLKHSGMWIDLDSHQGYGDFVGSWDMIRQYSMTLPIWLESPFGLGGKEHRYWAFIAGLHYHPDAIDVHPEFFTQSDPAWLRFVVEHLGVNINNTPDVWTVLRDAEYPLVSWGKGGVSGHMGDWCFWLYRREDAPQSATKRVWRKDMPAARNHVFSRQTRRTIQEENQIFMSFDIDDAYPYVNQKPVAVEGGNVYYIVYVTILNMGNDTFSLQYRNWDGAIVKQVRRKGPSLGKVNDWVTVAFTVRDGYFNNNMPGKCDFRISCERDGNEYIHMVRVKGGWGVPPTPTITPVATSTRRPTATRRPTSGPPPSATPRPTPTGPTPTPAPATPTPTPAFTPTPIPGAVRFDPVEDTYIDQWAPRKSWDKDIRLSARQGDIKAPLLRFDLSAIPSNSVVEKAVLSLCVLERTNPGYLRIAVYEVFRPWKGAECTWQQAMADGPWAVAGCNDPLQDRSDVFVADVWLTAQNRWYDLDLTPLVQKWVQDPQANYGLIIKASGATSVQYDFYSSEHPNVAMRPRLLVRWHEVTPTPIPPSPTPTQTVYHTPTNTPSPGPSLTPSHTVEPSPTPLPSPVSLVLREGEEYGRVADTFLDEWAENKNYMQSLKLAARQGGVRAPLMRFDLSSVPNYASVKRAILHLYVTGRTNPGMIKLAVAKVNRAWDPKHVTWNQATATEAWFQPGARDIGSDRSGKIYASGFVDGERHWTQWDVTSLVQEWVSDPRHNYGLILLAEGSVSVQYDFTTFNWYPEDYRPYLEVIYIPVPPSPTPVATNTPTQTPTPAATATATITPFPPLGNHIFQQGVEGYRGCTDTYVDRWNPQLNYVAKEKLIVRQGGVRSVLLRFDLSGLPISSRVKRAQLQLYVQAASGPHPLPVAIFEVSRPWKPKEVTFQRADKEKAWLKEGLAKLGADIAAQPIAQGVLSGEQRWVAFDITKLVQKWVTFPEKNYGLVIKAGGEIAVQYEFLSSEWKLNPALRPKLYVEWEPAPPTPTVTGTPPTPTPTNTPTLTPTSTATPTPTRERVKIALQQGLANYQGVSDTYLDRWNQSSVMGQNATFSVRQNGIRVGLIRYDLSRVPEDAILLEAKLNLWLAYSSNPGRIVLRAYRLRRPWNESAANWIEADTGEAWASPGAEGMEDHDPEVVGEAVLEGDQKWISLDISKAVRYWLQHPEKNFGLLLRSEGGVSVEHQFASSQWRQLHQRPKLLLTYELKPKAVGAEELPRMKPLQWLGIGVFVAVLVLLLLGHRRPPAEGEDKELVR